MRRSTVHPGIIACAPGSRRAWCRRAASSVGFHERKSSYVADMRQCENLPPHLSALLVPLRDLVAGLSIADAMPQIEVAVGEYITALVLLHPDAAQRQRRSVAARLRRPALGRLLPAAEGPATAYRFYPVEGPQLSYPLPDYNIEHCFSPTEFTQVNHAINRVLVRRAMALLDPQPGRTHRRHVLRAGNFTRPIASWAPPSSVSRAARNSSNARAERRTQRPARGASSTGSPTSLRRRLTAAALGHFDKMLIDPPREGALELVKAIGEDGTQADCVRLLQPGDAGARCGDPRDPERLPFAWRRRGQHVPEYLASRSIAPFERGEGAACCDEGAALSSAFAPLDE